MLVAILGIVGVLIASAFIVLQDHPGEPNRTNSPTSNAPAPEEGNTPATPEQPAAQTATTPSPGMTSTANDGAPGPAPSMPNPGAKASAASIPSFNFFDPNRHVVYWWRNVPESLRDTTIATEDHSNMLPEDHVGNKACIECHQSNHSDWTGHAHRRMHEIATKDTVEGDFSGGPEARIRYLGGTASFYTENETFRMSLERDQTRRVYSVERTIGSRFFQYYVGKLIEGPEPEGLPLRSVEHVLPFGYWLDRQEWVPTVHVFRLTREDDDGFDPFVPEELANYDVTCAACHTTLASGDWMMRSGGMKRLTWHTPRPLLFHVPGYLRESQPSFVPDFKPDQTLEELIDNTHANFGLMSIREEAAELGISCEACHNGCREHVAKSSTQDSESLPLFFPAGRSLFAEGSKIEELGRNDVNRNYICSRCHAGGRPEYASGHHTWNSTEYADAVRGGCYDLKKAAGAGMRALTCVQCHDPHKGIGAKWKRTPEQDDNSCLDCHKELKPEAARSAHTHHPTGSEGARCMNCHMPKINEGLQDMVRTHRIFSPTEPRMIEANQPNACNLCHLDKPIDWTLSHLREWYGDEHKYDADKLSENYADRAQAVGKGWLKSPHGATRLSATAAYARARDVSALPDLIELLAKDPKLVNRQFNQKEIEDWLGLALEPLGYQFYMTGEERRRAMDTVREKALAKARAAATGN